MSRDPEAAYYQTIEEYFVSRRGDPLVLSNADWTLVRKWRLAGLPLRVVLRGIRDALDAHALGWSRKRKVGSLGYCAREVEAARERWQRALGIGEQQTSGCRAALTSLAGTLEQALRSPAGLGPGATPVAREIAGELRDPPPGGRLSEVTPWLAEREARLVAAIAAEEPAETAAARAAEADEALRPWRGRMPEKVLKQLRQDSITRRTLESVGLPRLSLFHLDDEGSAS